MPRRVPYKLLVPTGVEQVERDATEFKFSKLVLHIRLNSFIYLSLATFGNAPFPSGVRQFQSAEEVRTRSSVTGYCRAALAAGSGGWGIDPSAS